MIVATLLIIALATTVQAAGAPPDAAGARHSSAATTSVAGVVSDLGNDDATLKQQAKADEPKAKAAFAAYSAWQDNLYDALSDGARPRDWALASQLLFTGAVHAAPALRPTRDELLDRAMQRAPDDFLVQWLVASDRAVGATCEVSPSPDEPLANLERLAPDNAATWLLALTIATDRHDAAAVDDALLRMAESSRYDEPYDELLRAWLDVYDAQPPPPASWALLTGRADDLAAYARFVTAQSIVAATALPGYEALMSACTLGTETGGDWRRFAWCDDAAHVMATHATTLIARSIGFALLRTLEGGELSASDRAAQRRLDWLRVNLMSEPNPAGAARALPDLETRWRQSGSEIAFYRNLMRDAGLPAEPPTGWKAPDYGQAVAVDTD